MRYSILAGLGTLLLMSGSSQAHFELLEPSASLVQDRLGDPGEQVGGHGGSSGLC